MASHTNSTDVREEAFEEIMEVVISLRRSGKIKQKLSDISSLLSECKEDAEGRKLPQEFKIIRLISDDPDALSNYFDTLLNLKRKQEVELFNSQVELKPKPESANHIPQSEDKVSIQPYSPTNGTDETNSGYHPISELGGSGNTCEQNSRDKIVTKIMSISKEWISTGTFDEIGEKEHCHRAMVTYLTELQGQHQTSVVHKDLAMLYFLIESGDIEVLLSEIKGILRKLYISKPEIFQDNFAELKAKFDLILNIANQLIFSGSFEDLGDQHTCMLAVSRYLLSARNDVSKNDPLEFEKTCDRIMNLHVACRNDEVKEEIRKIIINFNSLKVCGTTETYQYNSEAYTEVVTKVVKIVTDSITNGSYDDIDSDKAILITSAVAYLSIKETDFNTPYVLPNEHAVILLLHEKDDIDGLVKYLRKLLINARDSYALERIELRIEKAGLSKDSSSNSEKLISALGTTLTAGLSGLHVLAPMADSFKSLIENLNLALLNPALSSWLAIGGVSFAFAAGISIWNAVCVVRRTKSLKEAGKSVLDAVGPMAIGSAIAYGTAVLFASVAPPLWLSLLGFGAIGLGVHFIVQPIFSRFTKWLFYELPENQAIKKAYATLDVQPSVTDKELRAAYRHQTRKYHPDKKAQRDSSDDTTEKLHEVRQAYEYLITIRLRNMELVNEPGFFTRMRKYMASMWGNEEGEDGDDQIKTQALEFY